MVKLVRFGPRNAEKPGLIDGDGQIRDLSDQLPDISGDALSPRKLDDLAKIDPASLPLVGENPRLGPCHTGINRIIGIGLNYSDHAAETGMEPPSEPIVFMKACAATGPNDPIIIPRGSEKTDWEVELGVVIGQPAHHVAEAEALDYVAGYCVCNDVSERAYQMERLGQWTKGKSCDSFAPIGPWLVTKDEIPDPQDLSLWLDVNGHRYQNGNTKSMIFGVAEVVSYLSTFMTLLPGDVISTGTPPGVGMGLKPEPIFLKPGDSVRLGVDGLGEQVQTCVAWEDRPSAG